MLFRRRAKSDQKEGKQPASSSPTPPAPSPAPEADPISSVSGTQASGRPIAFDGKSDRVGRVGENPLETYTLDLLLISSELPIKQLEVTDTSPPMPFRLGGAIACYATPSGYSLLFRDNEKEVLRAKVSAISGATRITIVGTLSGIVVYCNGLEIERASLPAPLSGPIRVGAGFQKRFWTGEMKFFDLYDGVRVDGSFSQDSSRLPSTGRVFSLDQ